MAANKDITAPEHETDVAPKKRKVDQVAIVPDATTPKTKQDGSDDEDMDMLDVDFEWFGMDPEIDFLGLKTLLRQSLDVDHDLIDLSALVDLLLAQNKVGSTVKCDGKESDPFAYISLVDLHQHRETPVVARLREWLVGRVKSVKSLSQIQKVLELDSTARPALILTERFINMPAEIVPPLYKMLANELPSPDFTHFIILSKTYTEVASTLDQQDARPNKKSKKAVLPASETFYFHAEDEKLHEHALAHGDFDYQNQAYQDSSDAKRAFQDFGIRPRGHVIMLEAAKFPDAVKAIAEYMGQSTA